MNLGIRFENVVYKILELYNFSNLEREVRIKNSNYVTDVKFNINDCNYIVEIKYYRTKIVREELLKSAVAQLRKYSKLSVDERSVLIIPNVLSIEDKYLLGQKYPDVIFIGGNDLILSCNDDEILSELKSVIDFNIASSYLGESLSDIFKVNDVGSDMHKPENEPIDFIKKLQSIKPGKEDCYIYESLCKEIIKFLFKENIINEKTQHCSEDGLSRYDFVARISPKVAFWDFIVNEIGSRYVIFEFKNYQEEIKQHQVLTTEKYLLGLALRKVAFILCRNGVSNSAKSMIHGALRESGKVIFTIDDKDLIKMLELKASSLEPSDYLFEKADDLFMALSR